MRGQHKQTRFTVTVNDDTAGFNTLTDALSAVFLLISATESSTQASYVTTRWRRELDKRGRPHAVHYGAITLRAWATAQDAADVLTHEERQALQESGNNL